MTGGNAVAAAGGAALSDLMRSASNWAVPAATTNPKRPSARAALYARERMKAPLRTSETDAPLIVTSIVYVVSATGSGSRLVDDDLRPDHVTEDDPLGGDIQDDELVVGAAVVVVDEAGARAGTQHERRR